MLAPGTRPGGECLKYASLVIFAVSVAAITTTLLNGQGGQGGRGAGPAGRAGAATVEHIVVHGKSLEGDRDGESPDRDVTVYLPPSYRGDQTRRYPVVYLLQDSGARDNAFTGPLASLPDSADRLAAAAGFSAPIVVAPNALPSRPGGAWETFVAEDLVAYIDGRYRTINARISRGLGGYSAGGYAALRVGVKRPDVFSSLYIMSADFQQDAATAAELLTTVERNVANLGRYYGIAIDVGTKDRLLASNRQLHETMMRLKIPHSFEEYDGDHASRLAERIDRNLLPFFSKVLAAPANPTSPSVKD